MKKEIPMTKAKNEYTEIEEIRNDLDSLKTNVVALTEHLTTDGVEKVEELRDTARKGIKTLRAKGKEEMKNLERQVKQNPGKSILIAFCAGALANILLSRR